MSKLYKVKTDFFEQQKPNQWWLWCILIVNSLIPCYGVYKQLYIGEQFGTKPISDLGLIIYLSISFLILILFLIVNLKTKVNSEGIQMNFYPFVSKKVNWNEIKNIEIISYGFVGGYGIRLWTKYGTVYNVKGKKGIYIQLKNGVKFLIGTQKEKEMRKVLNYYSK